MDNSVSENTVVLSSKREFCLLKTFHLQSLFKQDILSYVVLYILLCKILCSLRGK